MASKYRVKQRFDLRDGKLLLAAEGKFMRYTEFEQAMEKEVVLYLAGKITAEQFVQLCDKFGLTIHLESKHA